jgi:hypothetical protein
MTADEALIDIAGRIERDLWNDLAAVPPESRLVRDICALAAQLTISQESSRIHGTPLVYARAFVEQTDALALKIDMIGGEKRINRSLLWMQFVEFEKFAMALLDLMVSCGL